MIKKFDIAMGVCAKLQYILTMQTSQEMVKTKNQLMNSWLKGTKKQGNWVVIYAQTEPHFIGMRLIIYKLEGRYEVCEANGYLILLLFRTGVCFVHSFLSELSV